MADTNWTDKQGQNNIWITPPEVLERVRAYFGGPIPLDPATEPNNPTEALRFFTAEDDGLTQSWAGDGVFVNPPYSLTEEEKAQKLPPPIRAFTRKIHEEAAKGVVIIALMPCGTRFSTGYWQQNILIPELRGLCWHKTRVKFINGITGERGRHFNQDTAYYGYNVNPQRFQAVFSRLGKTIIVEMPRANLLEGFV